MKICKGYRTGVGSPPIFINKKFIGTHCLCLWVRWSYSDAVEYRDHIICKNENIYCLPIYRNGWPLTQSENIAEHNYIKNENLLVTKMPRTKFERQNTDLKMFSTYVNRQ